MIIMITTSTKTCRKERDRLNMNYFDSFTC